MISEQVLRRIALRLRNELVIAAPSYNARLRSSIKVFPTEKGLRITMVEYGKYVEFGCFLDNNIKILTKRGEVKIKNLKNNDYIWNGYEYKKLIQKQTYEYMDKIDIIEIHTNNGKLKVTCDHPFLTEHGWKRAHELTKKDKLIGRW